MPSSAALRSYLLFGVALYDLSRLAFLRKPFHAGGSASGNPDFSVEQFACDLKVAGVRGRFLDQVQNDPADARDLGGVLRVRVEVEPAWSRGQRGDGEHFV